MLYSNNCRQDLKEIVCISLKNAKKSIYLSSYGLSDPEVLAIIQKKISDGLLVTVACHPKEISTMQQRMGSSIGIIPLQSKGLSHEKILILDNERVFLGSTNLTQTSLSLHDNILIGIYSRNLANHLMLRTPGDTHNLVLGEQNLTLHFLPEEDDFALDQIISMIDSAKKEIQIALFTFTHPKMYKALCKAKSRGIIVTVIMDQFLARGCCKKAVDILKKSSCAVRTSNSYKLMHHKWARIDRTILIAGSANWTKAAFNKNRDYILILTPINKTQNICIDKLWVNLYRHSIS